MEHHFQNEIFQFNAILQLDRQQMLLAKQKDDAQNQFMEKVFNTKRAAEDVYRAVDKLLIQRYCLKKGKKIKTRTLVACQETTKKARRMLETLIHSAEAFSLNVQYPIEHMESCYGVAVDITTASVQYEELLTEFQASLENDTADESIKLLGRVKKEHELLCTAVNSFPALHKKNHQLEVIQQSVRNATHENS